MPQAHSFALLDIGVHQTFFRDDGIDIDSASFGGGAKTIQTTIGGSIK